MTFKLLLTALVLVTFSLGVAFGVLMERDARASAYGKSDMRATAKLIGDQFDDNGESL